MMINGMPLTTKAWVVYRTIDGANWFWGSWDDLETAMTVAIEIGGEVCSA